VRALVIASVALVVAAIAAAAVLVFRDDGDEKKAEPIRIAPAGASIAYGSSSAGATAQPVARLPGITVVGTGEVEVKPDTALVRLTIGSGSGRVFPGSGEGVELIDEDDLEPVVDAVVDAGAPRDEVYVDTFNGSNFGPGEGAAVITLEWPNPHDVRKLLTAAQREIRKTSYSLQDVAVAFMREDCDDADEKTANAALADARKRAERLASLSNAKLGPLISVSEATSSSSLSLLSGLTQQRCGVESSAPGIIEYQSGAATADKLKVSTTLEVTFALER
jgi:uncharacterized protein YggE